MATKTYGIYEVKTNLSELLRFVANDGRVVITDRGKRIAQIISLKETDSNLEKKLQKLISLGQATPTSKKGFKSGVRRVGGLKRFLESRE